MLPRSLVLGIIGIRWHWPHVSLQLDGPPHLGPASNGLEGGGPEGTLGSVKWKIHLHALLLYILMYHTRDTLVNPVPEGPQHGLRMCELRTCHERLESKDTDAAMRHPKAALLFSNIKAIPYPS